MKTIEKDGITYYGYKQLQIHQHEDFFVETGTIEFGHQDVPVGYFMEDAFREASKIHSDSFFKYCENRVGYYCKSKKCTYPNCLKDKTHAK